MASCGASAKGLSPKSGPGEAKDNSHAKRKPLHRLTSEQSEVLESFFSICAHPDATQRKELSETTGLTENQVRFWFQNKRTHAKHLSGKEENYRLKMENQILRDENNKLKQVKRTIFCPSCTDEPRQLQILQGCESLKAQNRWMQQELTRLKSELPMSAPALNRAFQLQSSSENVFVLQDDTRKLAEITRNVVQEFVTLANSHGPMWLPVPGGSMETLNMMAYHLAFPGQSSAMGFKMEATRANAEVMVGSKTVVEFLMDHECHATFFPGIMSHGATTKVYNWPSNRNGDYDGALVLVTAEVVFPSPLVPTRKCTFLRCCKKLDHEATAIVDIPVEDYEGNFIKFRKLASGVLMQPMGPESCKVTVIEHVRVDDTGIHDLFKPCVSGLLFGARRWVMSIARHCARIWDVLDVTNGSTTVCTKQRKIMKMANTLLARYASNIAGGPSEGWIVQCGKGTEDDIKITYKRSVNSTNAAIVSASASFLVPVPMRRAFDLLKNNQLRGKWDVLVNGGNTKEEVRVASGIGNEDSVTILHIMHDNGESKETTMILQNCSYDPSGSFLVYSSLDKKLMDILMSPGDGDQEMYSVPVLPIGFYLVPTADRTQPNSAIGEAGGTVMTAGFQILMKMARGTGLSPRSVSLAIRNLSDQIRNVKDTLMNSHPIFYRGQGRSAAVEGC